MAGKKIEPVLITWTNKDDNTEASKGTDWQLQAKERSGLKTSASSA
jgi:hypothetical protein